MLLRTLGKLGRHARDAFRYLGSLAGAALFCSAAHASSTDACIEKAATAFKIDATVISIILEVEGGWPGAEIKNENGSFDLGPMQINTSNLARFQRFGISREELRDDRCINIYAGTHLLATHLRETGNIARAMARYHSATPKFAAVYLERIQGVIQRRLRLAVREIPASRMDTIVSRFQRGQSSTELAIAETPAPAH